MEPPSSQNERNQALHRAAQTLEAAGIESARLDAQLLLAQVLGVSRTAILTGLHSEPTPDQWQQFEQLIAERARRVPLAYLRGRQEFYGLSFAVSPAVLIPRPETELLVDFAREKLARVPDPVFADVGTGSGCIVVATLAHVPQAHALALDISPDALSLAWNNAAQNAVARRVRCVRGNLLDGAATGRFSLIVSNPPYIPESEIPTLQSEVRDFEPYVALSGGPDGLAAHRQIAASAPRVLQPGGWLAVEVARGQAANIAELFRVHRLTNVEIRRDLAGIERVVCGQKEE